MAKVTAEVVNLTPDEARKLLESNVETQRLISEPMVEVYKQLMLQGGWLETGEAIIVDSGGSLLNGQHRLRASSEGQYTLKNQVIVRGVSRAAFKAMDTGRKRMAADILAMAGHTNGQMRYGKVLAAVANYGILYSNGLQPGKSWGAQEAFRKKVNKDSPAYGVKNRGTVTFQDILEFVEKHPHTKSSVAMVVDMQGKKRLFFSSAILAWAHFQGRTYDRAQADWMVKAMITGQELKGGTPFLWLRELLLEENASRTKHNKNDVMAGFVKAWNATRGNGDKLTRAANLFKKDWETFPRFS